MKTVIFVFLAILFATPSIAQQAAKLQDDSPREQMRRLLDDFPAQPGLLSSAAIVKDPKTAKNKDELKHAVDQIKFAQERIPKIRALLKPGTTIFDYPGLLAKVGIQYAPLRQLPDGTFENGYRLYLGLFLEDEFVGPWDFYVFLDEKGIITAVKDVDWKH